MSVESGHYNMTCFFMVFELKISPVRWWVQRANLQVITGKISNKDKPGKVRQYSPVHKSQEQKIVFVILNLHMHYLCFKTCNNLVTNS